MTSSGAAGACDPRQRLKLFRLERALDGAQPVGPLGMAARRQVIETGGMGDQERGHGRDSSTGPAPHRRR